MDGEEEARKKGNLLLHHHTFETIIGVAEYTQQPMLASTAPHHPFPAQRAREGGKPR